MSTEFPTLLKSWRTKRHLSQMQLALQANVSARHISFLETGRAQPSKQMVAMLAQTLQMPMNDTNLAFLAAGFAPPFKQHPKSDADVAYIEQAVQTTLQNHLPLPALVLDRHWNITAMNAATTAMFAAAKLPPQQNLIDVVIQPAALKVIENWAEASQLLLHRLEFEFCESGNDATLGTLIQKLRRAITQQWPNQPPINYSHAVLPTRLRIGTQTLSLFSTIAQFGSVFDTHLGDLRIELMFPLDEATRGYFEEDHPLQRTSQKIYG